MKAIKRILCPVDLSEGTSSVVDVGSAMAAATGAEMTFLFVAVPELPRTSGFAIVEVEQQIEADRQRLLALHPTQEGIKHHHELIRGEAVDAILHYAEDKQMDLIVMATHGRSGLGRFLLGSVAEHVLRRATCPVLTIRARMAESS